MVLHSIYNSVFKQKNHDDNTQIMIIITQSDLCKNYKMSKAVLSRLVNKYKTKGTVETEHLAGRPKKSTPHSDRKVIRYVKTNHLLVPEIQFAHSIFEKILCRDVWISSILKHF